MSNFVNTSFIESGVPVSDWSNMVSTHQRLLSRWLDSKRTDLSVYHDPAYVLEGLHSWKKTKVCTHKTVKYFNGGNQVTTLEPYTDAAPDQLTLLDVYNGVGLTSLHLAANGFKVETFNNCVPQIEYMERTAANLDLPMPLNHTKMPNKQYDVVASLEVLEHFSEPMPHLRDLLSLIKPGGYLVESTGFGVDDQIGHFTEYTNEGGVLDAPKMRRLLSNELKRRCTKVYFGWGKMPRIWRLK